MNAGFRIPDTQMEAWESIQSSLPESRRQVLAVIAAASPHGISTFDVAQKLGWPINCVSGRITELTNDGVVANSGRRGTNPSGKSAILWVIKKQVLPAAFDSTGQGVFL